MTDEEYRKEQSKRFDQRYGWVKNWLDNYLVFNAEDPEATAKLLDDARTVILWLLDEINQNGEEYDS